MKTKIVCINLLLIAGFAQSAIISAEETTVFGPETFIKDKGKPQVIEKKIFLDSSDWIFTVQVQNGIPRTRDERVSGATIILNGIPIADSKDINKQVETFEVPVSILVEGENTLGVELKGSPGSFISVEIVKEPLPPNRGVQNADNDLWAWNTGEYVALWWSKPPDGTAQIVSYRSLSADGPWDKIFERGIVPYDPASGYWESQINPNSGIDFVDGRAADLYYRLEAVSATGEVVRNYAPVYVPKFVEEGLTQSGLEQRFLQEEVGEVEPFSHSPPYNEPFLSDEEYENSGSMTLVQISDLLKSSFLSGTIEDVDEELIDPAKLIYDAAQRYNINPQVLITTMQKESGAILKKVRLEDNRLKLIMGYSTPTTIRDQINDAAWQFRKYFHDLKTKGSTVSGWQVGIPKKTQDQITVIPANKAIAALFSYTPLVGGGWGGDKPEIGGNYLFWNLWYNQFKFGFIPAAIWRFKVAPAYMLNGGSATVSLHSLEDTPTKTIRYSPAKITQQLIEGTNSLKWGPPRDITLTNQGKDGDFFLYTGIISPSDYLNGYYNDGSGSGELYYNGGQTIKRCSLGIYNVLSTADIVIENVSPLFEKPDGPYVTVTAYFRQLDTSQGMWAEIFFINYDETLWFAQVARMTDGTATYGWESDFGWVRGILDVKLHEGDNFIQVYQADCSNREYISYVGASRIVNVPFGVYAFESAEVGMSEKEILVPLDIENINRVYPESGK